MECTRAQVMSAATGNEAEVNGIVGVMVGCLTLISAMFRSSFDVYELDSVSLLYHFSNTVLMCW